MNKKLLAVFLAVIMAFSVLCINISAEDPEGLTVPVEVSFPIGEKMSLTSLLGSEGIEIGFDLSSSTIGAFDGNSDEFETEAEYVYIYYNGVYYFYSWSEESFRAPKESVTFTMGGSDTVLSAEDIASLEKDGTFIFDANKFLEVFTIKIGEKSDALIEALDKAIAAAEKDMLAVLKTDVAEIKNEAGYDDVDASLKSAFDAALTNADTVIAKEDATADETDKAINDIKNAVEAITEAMKTDVEKLKDKIEALLNEAQSIEKDPDFINLPDVTVKENLDKAIADGNYAFENSDDIAVLTDARTALETAISEVNAKLADALKFKELEEAINNSSNIQGNEKYEGVNDSIKANLESALEKANSVLAYDNATKKQIADAADALNKANEAATEAMTNDIDKLIEKLSEAKSKAEALQKDAYYTYVSSDNRAALNKAIADIDEYSSSLNPEDMESDQKVFNGGTIKAKYLLKFKSNAIFGDLKYTASLTGFSAPPDLGGLGSLIGDVADSVPLPTTITESGSIDDFPSVESATVISRPAKTEYTDVEKFDATGLVVEATLTNGQTGIITYGEDADATFSFTPSANDRLTVGATEVLIKLDGVELFYAPVKVGHSYTALPVQISSDIGSEAMEVYGYHAIICEGCGEIDPDTEYEACVPDENWVSNNDATFAADGTSTCHCSVCGGELTKLDFRSAGYNITFSEFHFLLVIFDYIATLLRGLTVILG